MTELVTMLAALVAAASSMFVAAMVGLNLWRDYQQRRQVQRILQDQEQQPAPPLTRRQRRALARQERKRPDPDRGELARE